jgi:hypothetical protein
MHVELPKAKKWKEFSGEYVMIVISIVTALGLEHAVQTYHHRHQAHQASDRIEAELRANLKEIEGTLKTNEERKARIAKMRVALRDDLRRGTPDKDAIEHTLKAEPHSLQIGIKSPTLRHEAWDVAVANQAASFIEPDKLERYASLYAEMRDVERISSGSGNKFFDGPQLVTVLTDLDLGKASARDMLITLQQIEWSYGGADGNLQNVRDHLAKTFAPKTATTAQR